MSESSEDPIPPSFLYTMILLNLVVGVTIIILNSLVGHFYRRGKRSTAALLYTYLTGWDVTMGVTAVIHAVYMIITATSDVKAVEETMKVLVCVVYVMTNLAVRLSVFANTVLSVVRTINISQPFYRVRRRNLHIVYWVCFVFILILCVIDLWHILVLTKRIPIMRFHAKMFLNPALGSSLLEQALDDGTKNSVPLVIESSVSNMFYHLATLIAIICLVIQSKVLLFNSDRKSLMLGKVGPASENDVIRKNGQQSGVEAEVEKSEKRKSEWKTTITIIQLTSVFCVCNTAYSVSVVWLFGDTQKYGRPQGPRISDRLILYATSGFVPFLNSLINPLILIFRSDSIRLFVKALLGRK